MSARAWVFFAGTLLAFSPLISTAQQGAVSARNTGLIVGQVIDAGISRHTRRESPLEITKRRRTMS